MPLRSDEIYILEKPVWTHEDFETMGWHDVTIHAIAFSPEAHELVLDVDYIFAWVDPEPPSPSFSFWISPATLVFQNVADFKAEIGDPPGVVEPLGLQIMGISRKNPWPSKIDADAPLMTQWTWIIDLLQGEIEFTATGFRQYTRRAPVRVSAQQFSMEERGQVSFARPEVVS